MTEQEKETLREVLRELMDERSRIDATCHLEHHDWINAQIAKEKAGIERREEWTRTLRAVRTRILEWSMYALFFAVATKIYSGKWPDVLPGN